jgi:hypothetical protein
MSSDEEEWNDNNDDDNDEKKKVKAQNGTSAHEHTPNDDEDDDDDDDDMPISSLKSPRASKKAAPSYKEASDDDDDDDDDVPLISLVAASGTSSNKRKRESTNSTKETPKTKKSTSTKETSKKPSATKKKKTVASKPSPVKSKASSSTTTAATSSNKSYDWASAALYGSGCDKGLLIQRLLCRWWYAYTWPDLDNPVKPIPDLKQYDTLDGFPGVYIGTSVEVVGQLYDARDLSAAPSFRNFAQKSSAELQQLLITAIEEQKRQLLSHQQGTITADASRSMDDTTIKELDTMLKWTRKVNTSKADKDAITVLKAHGLKF